MEVSGRAVSIEEVLKKKLMSEWGYKFLLPEEVGLEEELKENDLVLKDADNLILICVLSLDLSETLSPLARRRFRGEVGRLARLSAYFNKAYIAIPEDVLTLHKNKLIDVNLLKESGIGLLAVDPKEGEVRQVLPPKPRTLPKASKVDLTPQIRELERKVRRLEEVCEELKRSLERLRDEVYEVRMSTKTTREEGPPSVEEQEEGEEEGVELEGVELPSFMRGNPWLEVLRRRGKDR